MYFTPSVQHGFKEGGISDVRVRIENNVSGRNKGVRKGPLSAFSCQRDVMCFSLSVVEIF